VWQIYVLCWWVQSDWQPHARANALRRLLLAARSSTSPFFVLRPLHAAADASPAELRIAVRPAEEGVYVDIVKRKGPKAT
jgi:protein ImuA